MVHLQLFSPSTSLQTTVCVYFQQNKKRRRPREGRCHGKTMMRSKTNCRLKIHTQYVSLVVYYESIKRELKTKWARHGSNTGPLDLQPNGLPTAPQTRSSDNHSKEHPFRQNAEEKIHRSPIRFWVTVAVCP